MVATIFAFTYGILILTLVNEVETEWLRIVGIIAAGWMLLAGALAGWQAFR